MYKKKIKTLVILFILYVAGLNIFSVKAFAENKLTITKTEIAVGTYNMEDYSYSGETDMQVELETCEVFNNGYKYGPISGEGIGIQGKIQYSRNLTDEEKNKIDHSLYIHKENGESYYGNGDDDGAFWSNEEGMFMIDLDDTMPSGKYVCEFTQVLGNRDMEGSIGIVVTIHFEYQGDNSTQWPEEPTYDEDGISGTSGDLKWKIDDSGCLTITGDGNYERNGVIVNYIYDSNDLVHITGIKVPQWVEVGYMITSVIVNAKGMTSCANMFYNLAYVESMDLEELHTERVTDMSGMFYGCDALKELNVSNLKTENVTDMSSMFSQCSVLASLDVSNFDTSKVENMSDMFGNCSSLKSLDLKNFKTQNVTDMLWMFGCCENLETLDVSSFNTQNVKNMCEMFYGCVNLKDLDVSKFQTSRVNNMTLMFGWCKNLKSIDVSGFDTKNVTGFGGMFQGCSALSSVNVGNFVTDQATHMWQMFAECENLTELDISNFNTSKVLKDQIFDVFAQCIRLTQITVPKNVIVAIPLPTVEGYGWVDENENVCTEIKAGIPKNAVYIRKKQEDIDNKPETDNKPEADNKPETDNKPEADNKPETDNKPEVDNKQDTDNKPDSTDGNSSQLPAVGTQKTISSVTYKVSKSSSKVKEVSFVKFKSSKKTSITIPATVKIQGQTYKVTEIEPKALKNNKKLKSVTIGKNIKKIGKEAFCGCSKLKKIKIKSSQVKSVGKDALKNIYKKAAIQCPEKQLQKYKKLFTTKTGYKKTMKLKKINNLTVS